MIYLLLSIASSTSIFLLFKLFSARNIDRFPAIVVNYLFCCITGLFFIDINATGSINIPWQAVVIALILGVLFITTFYLMAYVAHAVSASASSVASKISLVVPVSISLAFTDNRAYEMDIWNYLGLGLSLLAIVLSSSRKSDGQSNLDHKNWIYPLLIFVSSGAIDSLINFVNANYLDNTGTRIFPIILFFTAFFLGSVRLISSKEMKKPGMKEWLGGAGLGFVNYFSIYFVLLALKEYSNDGAVVFPLNNIGTIFASSILAVIIFREHLLKKNIAGLVLSFLSLMLIAHQSFF